MGVLLNIFLIPKYGLIGAASATLFSYLIFNIIKFIMLKRLYQFDPFSFKTIVLLLIFASCWGVNLLLPFMGNIYLDIIIRSTIITSLYIFANYYLSISELFNELIVQAFKYLKIKI
jgi:hypothetical protein